MRALNGKELLQSKLSMLGLENQEIGFYEQIARVVQKILDEPLASEFINLFERLTELIHEDGNVYSLEGLREMSPEEVFSYIIASGQGKLVGKELRALILAEAKELKD